MYFVQNFYNKTLKYDLINKFVYQKTSSIPKIQKIVLSFESKTTNLKQLTSSLLTIELITNQKGLLTRNKKSNIILKLRKGDPVSCRVTLRGQNLQVFLTRVLIEILPKIRALKKFKATQQIENHTISYKLYNIFVFSELENYYYFLSNLPKLDIFITTNARNKKEFIFLLQSLQFPL